MSVWKQQGSFTKLWSSFLQDFFLLLVMGKGEEECYWGGRTHLRAGGCWQSLLVKTHLSFSYTVPWAPALGVAAHSSHN